MAVINSFGDYTTDLKANEKLANILTEIKKISNNFATESTIQTTKNKIVVLKRRGKMFWWTKCENAFIYRLRLFIDNCEVSTIDLDRNTRYYTFQDLDGFGLFKLKLEVEDHEGQILSEMFMNF